MTMMIVRLAYSPGLAISPDCIARSSMNLKADKMSDTLPDRLSIDPNSPYYNAELLQRGIGINLNGTEKTNVEEYCVSEGWIRVAVANSRDRKGNPMTIKLRGAVEAFIKGAPADAE